MWLQAAAIFGAGTSFSEFTVGTELRGGLVFIVVSPFVIMPSVEGMSRRRGEGLFRKDPLLSTSALVCLLKRGDMGLDLSITADEIVLNGAVFTVSNHGIEPLLGILLMDPDHLCEHITIIY
jgi:hypothetical protein